ncbi:MAG: nucleotidyltransferase domain-containing protein [Acidimicrobiia bacterium]
MNVSNPILDVIPGHRGTILAALAALTSGRVTGRQLAAHAGVPVTTTHRVLTELVDAGIVHAENVGASTLFHLNRSHLAAHAIIELASIRVTLAEQIQSAVHDFSYPPIAGWLFGSTARGDGTGASDIDIALVAPHGTDTDAPPWADDVAQLAATVHAITGNPVHIDSYTPAEFRKVSGGGFAATLQAEGIELVHGGDTAALASR